jgi:hypothetical protein
MAATIQLLPAPPHGSPPPPALGSIDAMARVYLLIRDFISRRCLPSATMHAARSPR